MRKVNLPGHGTNFQVSGTRPRAWTRLSVAQLAKREHLFVATLPITGGKYCESPPHNRNVYNTCISASNAALDIAPYFISVLASFQLSKPMNLNPIPAELLQNPQTNTVLTHIRPIDAGGFGEVHAVAIPNLYYANIVLGQR